MAAFLGDVRGTDDFQAADDGVVQVQGVFLVDFQHTVAAKPDPDPVLLGLHVDVTDITIDGVEDDRIHQADGRIFILPPPFLGALLEPAVHLLDGIPGRYGRSQSLGKELLRLLLVLPVQRVGEGHHDPLVLLELYGEIGPLFPAPWRDSLQQGHVHLGEAGVDEWIAHLQRQDFHQLLFFNEVVGDEDFAYLLAGTFLLLNGEGGVQFVLLQQPQLHKEGADAHAHLVLAYGIPNLGFAYIAQFQYNIEQRLFPPEFFADTPGMGHLFGTQCGFRNEQGHEFAIFGRDVHGRLLAISPIAHRKIIGGRTAIILLHDNFSLFISMRIRVVSAVIPFAPLS